MKGKKYDLCSPLKEIIFDLDADTNQTKLKFIFNDRLSFTFKLSDFKDISVQSTQETPWFKRCLGKSGGNKGPADSTAGDYVAIKARNARTALNAPFSCYLG